MQNTSTVHTEVFNKGLYKDINDITRKTAASMIQRLNEYQNSTVEVPTNILKG
jgi:hypothetical protein